MAGIVGVALALAALRNASSLTATIAHNLVFLMLPLAIVVAVVAKATPRGVSLASFASYDTYLRRNSSISALCHL